MVSGKSKANEERSQVRRFLAGRTLSPNSRLRLGFESLESRWLLATIVDFDDVDSHAWFAEAYTGSSTNVVDWVEFDGRRTLRSQVTTSTGNYSVIRTGGFPVEDWRGKIALQAKIYQAGGADGVDLKLEVRGNSYNPPIEQVFCGNLPHDTWATCTWSLDTTNLDYDAISHLSLVFDNLANTTPTFYLDDMQLVSSLGSDEWDDMDDDSRHWFYFGNWFEWLPNPEFGLELVTHNANNPTTPTGSLYLEWDVDRGCCPESMSAEIGTRDIADVSNWRGYNRIMADVKVTDPSVPLNVFFWDDATTQGFGTPTRTVGVSNEWRTITWDVPWPSSFDPSQIDEIKFIVNQIDQHHAGTLFLDNIRLVDDALPVPVADGLDYQFASFEREGEGTDFSSNWGVLGVPQYDIEALAWSSELPDGSTAPLDRIQYDERQTLHYDVTSTGNDAVIRTAVAPAMNWSNSRNLLVDIYQSGGPEGVDVTLRALGPLNDQLIESVTCSDIRPNAWTTCSWMLNPEFMGYGNVAALSITFSSLNGEQPEFYLDKAVLVPSIGVRHAVSADGAGGALAFDYRLPADGFIGTFFSLWGNSDCKLGGPASRCGGPQTLDFTDIFGASTEQKSIEQIQFQVRGSGFTQNSYNVKVELKDATDRFDRTAFRYITIDDGNTDWQQVVLDADVLNHDFWSYNGEAPDPRQMKFLVFVVESAFNPPSGTFFIDNIRFVDADDRAFIPNANTDDAFLDLVSRRSFSYFLDWYDPTTGLFQDRSEFPNLMSVASTGFGLTALIIGEKRGWLDRQTALDMITRTLTTLRDGQSATDSIEQSIASTNGRRGFYYHFLDTRGLRSDQGSELSSVDTAILMMGALMAKEHFADDPDPKAQQVVALVDELYERIEWEWMLDSGNNRFFQAWSPLEVPHKFEIAASGGGFFSTFEDGRPLQWDYSTDEVMLINILAIASSTHPVTPDVFYAWARNSGQYAGHELVHSFNGSFFTYFFAHLWIDFRPLGVDSPPSGYTIAVDWWNNSVAATQASQQFAMDHADDQVCDPDDDYTTYGANSFGFTASDGPDGKYHAYGALPVHPGNSPDHDGTVAPYGAAGAILFQPQAAINALKHYFTDTQSWNYRLGFGDAFQLDSATCEGPWYNHAVFGIDNGPMLIALENSRSDFVWDTIRRNSEIAQALALLFTQGDLDFGDAPDSYGTTLGALTAGGGARHGANGPRLGAYRDAELDAVAPLVGSGDDQASYSDEDGVVAISTLFAAGSSTKASVAVTALQAGKLDVWIDFNRDGAFSDVSEHLGGGISIPVTEGLNLLSFDIPADAVPGPSYARYRLSLAGGLTPTGPADNGEVEDYAVILTAVNSSIKVTLPTRGELYEDSIGGDILVHNGQTDFFRGPGSSIANLRLVGSDEDDVFNLADLRPSSPGAIRIDAGEGVDQLRLIGSGHDLNLLQIAEADFQGVEMVDIRGSGANRLELNAAEVASASPTTDALFVRSDTDDTIVIGAGWTLTGTQVEEGQFVRILSQSNATLRLVGPHDWTFPQNPLDVDTNGGIEPRDALIVITELNNRQFSSSNGALFSAAELDNFPGWFFDVSPDGFVIPLDGLLVINRLNGVAGGMPEGEIVIDVADTVEMPEDRIELLPEVERSARVSHVPRKSAAPVAWRVSVLPTLYRELVNHSRDSSLANTRMLDRTVTAKDELFTAFAADESISSLS